MKKKQDKNNSLKLIVFFFVLSLIIRIIPIFNNAISFHYDMSRDAFVVLSILQGDLKIQGPPTSTPGLYHGVFYYYLLAPFYLIGNGDPRIVAFGMALINSLTVIPVLLLTKSIFKSQRLMLLAGLLFAISFESTQYALWLSNPSPAILTVSLFFYGLWHWLQGNIKGFYLSIFMAALSAQFQFFLTYLFVVVIIFYLIFKPKLRINQLLVGVLITFLMMSSFLIALVKFKSLGPVLSGVLGITGSSQADFRVQFTDHFFNYVNHFADIFINNFFPTNVLLGGLLGIITLFMARGNRFVIFCLLSNSFLFLFGGHSSSYVNVGLITPAILAFVYLVNNIQGALKLATYLLVVLIVLSNLFMIYKHISKGQLTLVIPKEMTLSNQLSLIDKSYQIAQGKPFSINTLTLPLWTNSTWSYLYDFYGRKKYGYTPSFYGRDQVGLPGDRVLEKALDPQEITFLILEPGSGIPTNLYNEEIANEDGKTRLVNEYKYGGITLQQRQTRKSD